MIITSLMDNDLYKFTMMQAALHNYPGAVARYKFKCRTPRFKFEEKEIHEIITQVKYMCSLSFDDKELWYLKGLNFLSEDFIQFLKLYKPDYNYIHIDDKDECGLRIEVEGPWVHTILFEVPLLSIVSEVVNKGINPYPSITDVKKPLKAKMKLVNEHGKIKFADFGTRRRYAHDIQKLIIRVLAEECDGFIGTSNVKFAYTECLKPIGTMAHEWIQAHQALGVRLIDSQKAALETWVKEYRGDLGIALTDTIGVDAFLKDFDLYYCKLFDGVRHDSGDPVQFGYKIIDHYIKKGANPGTKTIVFSDSLTFEKMVELYDTFAHHINVSFGIGTNLMNDVGKNKPLSIVMKMVECNGQPVAKISDDPGKGMCEDESYVQYLKSVFKI